MAQENAAIVDVQNGEHNGVSFFALKPQLVIPAPKANDAVQFYKNAFGAEELKRVMHPKRKAEQELPLIHSAELKLGSTIFSVSDQADDSDAVSSAVFCLETDDVAGAVDKAVAAGAVIIAEVSEGEGVDCGGCVGKVKDPYGLIWTICSPAKESANEEV
ncbi:hypothetical protein NE237_011192 [Protea cynaroides]|uniref:VOC domain-containing protein n=1 Tax=Protea cynaroides TaxID=273540 RepID=A0A9Q0JVM0_9MAGN|nr:hypothetical protein NE237_011192 [Protea cynaroides]